MGGASGLYTILTIVLLASLSKCSFAQGNASYVVVAPQIMRAGSAYDVIVTIFGATSSVTVNVRLHDSRNVSVATSSTTVGAGSTMTVRPTLQIPLVLSELEYTLAVQGTGGNTFHQTRTVEVKSKTLSIFVQTDKATYKPSQQVLFRVVTVYPDLKPFMEAINVSISDNADNKIAQWLNQQNDTGVFSSSLQLSDQPPLGPWTITVIAKGNTVTKTFVVDEYVLPKFEVTVDLPSYYLLMLNRPLLQKNLSITVTAKYTYGQPVRGRADIAVSIQPYRYEYDRSRYGMKRMNVELDEGKADTSVTIEELVAMLPSNSRYENAWSDLEYRVIVVAANVTEAATGTTLSGNNTVRCTSTKYVLSFLDITPTSFKPGLSVSAYLQLKQYDGTAPLPEDIQSNPVSVRVAYHTYGYRSTSYATWNLTVPASGIVTFTVPVDPASNSITMMATFNDSASNTTISQYKYMEKFDSRDNQGIQILLDNSDGIIEAGQTALFTVTTTTNVTYFSYQLLSKGIVFRSGSQTGTPSTENRLSITMDSVLAQKLSPHARLVVWYITELGEIVSDSLDFTVDGAFANEVSVTFSKKTVQPADTVSITVAAHPASYVGLLAVDQSVLLLREGNDITRDSVIEDLSSYASKAQNSYNPIIGPPPFERPPAGRGPRSRRKRQARERLPFPIICPWPFFSGGTNSDEVFTNAGVLVMTDAFIQRNDWYYEYDMIGRPGERDEGERVPGPQGPSPPTDTDAAPDTSTSVRSNFPETWIWTETTTDADGQTTMTATMPDTITSWVLSAFAINSDVGLGVAPERAEITVFKPFFVSLTLPYSTKRGEEFALQATVFNYLSISLQATVTLKESDYFKVRVPNAILPQKQTVSAPVQVNSKDAMSTYFWIVPERLGQIPLEVSVVAGYAADAVRRLLLVEPEGIASEYSTSTYINLASGETYSGTLNISFPADGDLVPGSQYIEVTAIGNLMGQSLDGLGDLLQMPYGCGEQNMLHFAPDVYVLKYFEATGQTAGSVVTKARRYINEGYQRELTYQRSDGSFSAFGNSDKSGSTWLSAFVAKCFHEARDFIPVDDRKIAETLTWLIRIQASNGSFSEPPYGRVLHRDMQGGSAGGVALTAYVVISMLENSNNAHVDSASFRRALANAVRYLESHLRSAATDPYALSIITYALTLGNSSQANSAFRQLDALAISKDGLKYWHKASSDDSIRPVPEIWRAPYQRARSVDIEMTAYALLTYTLRGDISGSVPIAKWIVAQRNSNGGFSSTQDTVVALQALAEYAALTSGNSAEQNLAITVTADTLTHTFTITGANALVLQSVQIPSAATVVSLEATGSGIGLVQLNVKFYYYGTTSSLRRNETTVSTRKNIELNIVEEEVDDMHITLRSCARWLGSEVSGMAILEINKLTGYVTDNDNQLQSQSSVVKRVDSDESKIILYLDELTANATCFTLNQTKSIIVENVQPASVTTYLYYDPLAYDTLVYQPVTLGNSTWCDRCPSCCECNPVGFFQCPGSEGPCIRHNQKCDGIDDCPDSSDENDRDCNSGNGVTSSHLLMGLLGITSLLWQLLTA